MESVYRETRDHKERLENRFMMSLSYMLCVEANSLKCVGQNFSRFSHGSKPNHQLLWMSPAVVSGSLRQKLHLSWHHARLA